ncbi:fimbrial biogenesis chaperone [Atlantibacter subterraneus]|uniref:fimbrial biogenesis chaperone n=1 Tax=Atlantibacter subterraneus TaxID=255519 RepID=UPI0028AF291E|nr:molecular chaperone [Atlantibacter subterranea]
MKVSKAALLMAALFSTSAFSGVEIGGTRLIYDGNKNQAAISVNNPDDRPYLIQAWVNKNENSDDNDDTFITTPPLFRLDPHKQNSVRVVLSGKPPATDKESVYWLNIKSIPASAPNGKNELTIAVKSKMKLIYRPAGIKGDPATAYQQLQFSLRAGKLVVKNPTPFSVSLHAVKINGKAISRAPMVLPQQEMTLPNNVSPGQQIDWQAINDFGGITAPVKVQL